MFEHLLPPPGEKSVLLGSQGSLETLDKGHPSSRARHWVVEQCVLSTPRVQVYPGVSAL